MMDLNLSAISGTKCDNGERIDLQWAIREHHIQPELLPGQGPSIGFAIIHENPGSSVDFEQIISTADVRKSVSDDGDPGFLEESSEGRNDANESKKSSPWHRVKWSDSMVRLLVTAVSYTNDEAAAEYARGQRKKIINLQKKGKWKAISKVMTERGYFVSPQQCEDKFNDLNKKYKRLNDILGRGTSCEVVENPYLLDMMDHVSEKSKEEVKRILSSKHLHYEEMCSYHNGNRLHLPPDPVLQQSLRIALMLRDDQDDENDNDMKCHLNNENGEADHNSGNKDPYGSEKVRRSDDRICDLLGSSTKRAKHILNSEYSGYKDFSCFLEENRSIPVTDPKQAPEGTETHQEQWISHRNLELEEQRLQIQEQMVELEKERLKWLQCCLKEDEELEITKMEIQRMKVDNQQMALELKQQEMVMGNNLLGVKFHDLAGDL